jgi:cytoskeletal protein CcmA (bactofilin family)
MRRMMMGRSLIIESSDSDVVNGFRGLSNETSRSQAVVEPSLPSRQDSYLPKGTEIIGGLFFEGPVIIDGHVDGDITARDKVVVDQNGVVRADKISAGSVVIGGAVKVNSITGHLIEILATGRVVGDLTSQLFCIHDGAQFEGNVQAGECRKH